MEVTAEILQGDSPEVLKGLEDNSIDLIFTSPPYADSRKDTYGGIHPDRYVEWFLPVSEQLLRVLKHDGSFVLNIKEKVVKGEQSTYVIELILALRQQGWLWTEEFVWHKKIPTPANGQTDSVMLGSAFYSSTKIASSRCIRKKSWCLWETGQSCV